MSGVIGVTPAGSVRFLARAERPRSARAPSRGTDPSWRGLRAHLDRADAPLRSAEARAAFGVDGSGVTIRIISDSFDELTAPPGLTTSPPGRAARRRQPVWAHYPGRDTARIFRRTGGRRRRSCHGAARARHRAWREALVFAGAGNSELEMAQNILGLANSRRDRRRHYVAHRGLLSAGLYLGGD